MGGEPVSLIETVRRHLPPKYRELAKFLVVGGTAWIVDTGLFTVLSHTVLSEKVITAKAISILIATVLSYVLNREWSFRTRGGRERHHEALLFFLINGVGIALNSLPLYVSRYLFDLQEPHVSRVFEEIADFASAQVIGTLIAMAFRWYGYKKWVFPDADARPRKGVEVDEEGLGHS